MGKSYYVLSKKRCTTLQSFLGSDGSEYKSSPQLKLVCCCEKIVDGFYLASFALQLFMQKVSATFSALLLNTITLFEFMLHCYIAP